MPIEITTNLAPKNGQKFYLLDTLFGKGGKIEVPTFQDLLDVPVANRKDGMWGFDQSTRTWYECDASLSWTPLVIGGGNRASEIITQISHGFIKGDVVGFDGNIYTKVIANDTDETDTVGIISRVIDADTFEVTYSGLISLQGVTTYADNVAEVSITGNTRYFLSPFTAGRLELNEADQIGQVKKPVLIVLSPSIGIVQISTGIYITEDQEVEFGYQIIQKDGTSFPSRNKINFVGVSTSIVDDPTNNRTNITITGQELGLFSGDIINSGSGHLTTVIKADVVNNSKLANMPPLTFKANNVNATGDPMDLTVAQAKALLGVASGTVNKLAKFNSTTTVGNSNITDTGTSITISYLAGIGNRMVIADANGLLSTQSIVGSKIFDYGGITYEESIGNNLKRLKFPNFSKIFTGNETTTEIINTRSFTNTSLVGKWFLVETDCDVFASGIYSGAGTTALRLFAGTFPASRNDSPIKSGDRIQLKIATHIYIPAGQTSTFYSDISAHIDQGTLQISRSQGNAIIFTELG